MDTLLYGIGRYGKKSMRRGGDLNVAVHLSDGIVWYAGAEDPTVVDEVRALYPGVDFRHVSSMSDDPDRIVAVVMIDTRPAGSMELDLTYRKLSTCRYVMLDIMRQTGWLSSLSSKHVEVALMIAQSRGVLHHHDSLYDHGLRDQGLYVKQGSLGQIIYMRESDVVGRLSDETRSGSFAWCRPSLWKGPDLWLEAAVLELSGDSHTLLSPLYMSHKSTRALTDTIYMQTLLERCKSSRVQIIDESFDMSRVACIASKSEYSLVTHNYTMIDGDYLVIEYTQLEALMLGLRLYWPENVIELMPPHAAESARLMNKMTYSEQLEAALRAFDPENYKRKVIALCELD